MDEGREGLKAAAEDILKAVHGADASALLNALESFFYLIDSEPHEEGGMSEGGFVDFDDHHDQRNQARRFGER